MTQREHQEQNQDRYEGMCYLGLSWNCGWRQDQNLQHNMQDKSMPEKNEY